MADDVLLFAHGGKIDGVVFPGLVQLYEYGITSTVGDVNDLWSVSTVLALIFVYTAHVNQLRLHETGIVRDDPHLVVVDRKAQAVFKGEVEHSKHDVSPATSFEDFVVAGRGFACRGLIIIEWNAAVRVEFLAFDSGVLGVAAVASSLACTCV